MQYTKPNPLAAAMFFHLGFYTAPCRFDARHDAKMKPLISWFQSAIKTKKQKQFQSQVSNQKKVWTHKYQLSCLSTPTGRTCSGTGVAWLNFPRWSKRDWHDAITITKTHWHHILSQDTTIAIVLRKEAPGTSPVGAQWFHNHWAVHA